MTVAKEEEEGAGDVVYLVRKEPGAEPQRVPRSKLRHRVVEKQCHPGITDDKNHYSYTMRYFTEKTTRHLKGEVEGSTDVVGAHGLTALPSGSGTKPAGFVVTAYIHSDNAAQHFKSSKSHHFFCEAAVWDIGWAWLHLGHLGLRGTGPRLVGHLTCFLPRLPPSFCR